VRFRRTPPPEEPRGPSPAEALRCPGPRGGRGCPVLSAHEDQRFCSACGNTGKLPARTAPTPGEVVPEDEDEDEDEQRADDLALLRALVSRLATDEEDEGATLHFGEAEEVEALLDEPDGKRERRALELEAFADMLGSLSRGRRTLSKDQRAWATGAAERLDVEWGEPGKRNRVVPRGAEVALLVDASPRPLDPPTRKVGGRTFATWAKEAGYPHTGDVAKARELWRAGVPPRRTP